MRIKDDVLIDGFIGAMSMVIIAYTKDEIHARGMTVEKEEGQGINAVLFLISGNNDGRRVEFSFKNTLLEIATMDRDEEPLRFDHSLKDHNYYMHKVKRIMCSKIQIFECVLNSSSHGDIHENLKDLFNTGGYERMRISPADGQNDNQK